MDDFLRVDMLTAIDPQSNAGVIIIIDKQQAEFEGDLGALNWGEATGRILITGIKTARESLMVGCVYIPPTARDRVPFEKALADIAHECLSGRQRYNILCGD